MKIIEKKIWSEYFDKVANGDKNFELRLADWDIEVGDRLILKEWDPKTKEYTGRELSRTVTVLIKTKGAENWGMWPKEEIEKYGFQIIGFKPNKLYRFSPIKTKEELYKAIEHIHFACHKLCKQSFGKYLPNAGNVGVFCHYENEYNYLLDVRKQLTESSDNVNQKYFKLHNPITIESKFGDVPTTTYEYLYIRKPDPYRSHVGDLDFYLEPDEYKKLKQDMIDGRKIMGARVFDRPDLDMIELYDPDSDALGYVSTAQMSKAVRVKLSEHTKL